MLLIGLHGLPRSGKDTVARILVSAKYFERLAFADPLKQAASVLLRRPLSECHGHDYDREQLMPEWGFTMRWFLQVFGTECLRQQIGEDFWIRRMQVELDQRVDESRRKGRPPPRLVITDVRFQNEADMIRRRGGRVIEVVRPGTVASNHVSDQRISPDWTIRNDGTLDDLFNKVVFEDVLRLKAAQLSMDMA